MGQGGFVTIVNGTTKKLVKTAEQNQNLCDWNFPKTIAPKDCVRVYVEWSANIFKNHSGDHANTTYCVEGTNDEFEIQAKVNSRSQYEINIFFKTLETQTVSAGKTIPLSWIHDGEVFFILAGEPEKYFSSGGKATSWMQDNMYLLKDKTLKEICIVGSHDSGMSEIGPGGTAFTGAQNTLTQSCSIGEQLNWGARYFDIRPVIGENNYYTGHYSHIDGLASWQGQNGQSIDSIISEINAFTAKHNELIILNISHSLNTTLGNNSYRKFNQKEWENLLVKLCGINKRYLDGQARGSTDLTTVMLGNAINGKSAVMIVIDDKNETINLGEYERKGFFTYKNFDFYDSYSDTNDAHKMADDQINKMKKNASKESLFLLSWTLTQGDGQAIFATKSIIDLSVEAHQLLPNRLYHEVTKNIYPNIIYLDNIKVNTAAALAMAVNVKVLR